MKAKRLLDIVSECGVNFKYCGIVHEIGELNGFSSIADHLKFYFNDLCIVKPDEKIETIPHGDYFWIYESDTINLKYPKRITENATYIIKSTENLYLIHIEE